MITAKGADFHQTWESRLTPPNGAGLMYVPKKPVCYFSNFALGGTDFTAFIFVGKQYLISWLLDGQP